MIEPLEIIVFGNPKPQGSKKGFAIRRKVDGQWFYTGKVALVDEPTVAVGDWRDAVMAAGLKAIRCDCGDPTCTALRPGFPWDFPIEARMVFTMPRPKVPPFPWPAGNVGDVSKLTRSTEDALALKTGAGVFTNDCRIVGYSRLWKCYPDTDPESLGRPGARIILRPAAPPRPLIEIQEAMGRQGGLF